MLQGYVATNATDIRYLRAAYTNIDTQLGGHPLGMSFVTGLGHRSPSDPLCEVCLADGVDAPYPGIPVFGTFAHLSNGHPYYYLVQHDASNYPYVMNTMDAVPILRRYVDEKQVVPESEFTIGTMAHTAGVLGVLAGLTHSPRSDANGLCVGSETAPACGSPNLAFSTSDFGEAAFAPGAAWCNSDATPALLLTARLDLDFETTVEAYGGLSGLQSAMESELRALLAPGDSTTQVVVTDLRSGSVIFSCVWRFGLGGMQVREGLSAEILQLFETRAFYSPLLSQMDYATPPLLEPAIPSLSDPTPSSNVTESTSPTHRVLSHAAKLAPAVVGLAAVSVVLLM